MFSIRLKELRTLKGLSQRELAAIFKVSTGTVGNWEVGTREPDFKMTMQLADFFQVSVDYLMGHNTEPPTTNNTMTYTNDEQKLISDYRSLNFACKKLVKQTIETLKNSTASSGSGKAEDIY